MSYIVKDEDRYWLRKQNLYVKTKEHLIFLINRCASNWLEIFLTVMWEKRRMRWRVEHLEKLIKQNCPKEDWYSVYGIKL